MGDVWFTFSFWGLTVGGDGNLLHFLSTPILCECDCRRYLACGREGMGGGRGKGFGGWGGFRTNGNRRKKMVWY